MWGLGRRWRGGGLLESWRPSEKRTGASPCCQPQERDPALPKPQGSWRNSIIASDRTGLEPEVGHPSLRVAALDLTEAARLGGA